ncbi:hypothetical protein [Deinococcus sonorensis]|uniref:HTH iclR-type domain-containing protein n=2 Tax=Deinococcus sonorensis TaxID=309891 RepID=A0AAU7U5G7_9DEIO
MVRASLAPFLGASRTAQDAAHEVGVPLTTMTSRIRQFVHFGLLVRVGEQPRRGRPMPLYRAPGSLFIPFDVTPLESDQQLGDVLFQGAQRRLSRSIGAAWVEAAGRRGRPLGLHVYREPGGHVSENVEPRPAPGEQENAFFMDLLSDEQPAVWDSWGVLYLDQAQAKALQRELFALRQRYGGALANGRPYLLRLAVAPLQEEG